MDLQARLRFIHGNNKREPIISKRSVPIFEGGEVSNREGTFFLREVSYSSYEEYQGYSFMEGLKLDLSSFFLLDRSLAMENKDHLLFLDTETTGLVRGTGTVAFMVGIGFFRNKMFHVKQYFMRDFYEEGALLFSLKNLLEEFKILVFFNGKSFDLPILKDRFTLNRLSFPWEDLLLLDLLHLARRFYQRRIGGCSLKELEEKILGFSRFHDVDGALIPTIYFNYLESGNGDLLRPIFMHNEFDLISMLFLLTTMVQTLNKPELMEDGLDLYSQACLYQKKGAIHRAIELYQLSLEKGLSSYEQFQVQKELSLLYKREGEFALAISIWEGMLEGGGDSLFPHIELAKYYEHRRKDLLKAKYYAELAQKKVQKKGFLYQKGESYALKHRLQRILKKMEKGVC